MDPLFDLFIFRVHPAELFLRASLMYWALFLTFRFIVRRDAGSLGLADLVFVVIVADAAQNALAGEYKTVAEGVVVVGVLVGWNFVLDWAGFRFPRVQRLLQPAPLRLVADGRPVYGNLRKEHIALTELDAQLRQSGVEDISQVREAFLESDGRVSVLLYENSSDARSRPTKDETARAP
jgi:uncharacterized membrane protein YcaP (DUF421 family)